MYCEKCGVKINDEAKTCPLCGRPLCERPADGVPAAADRTARRRFSDRFPDERYQKNRVIFNAATLLLAAAPLICLLYCLRTHGDTAPAGFAAAAAVFIWTACVLPLILKKREPLILIPVDFAVLCGALLYCGLRSGQSWLLSFALPVGLTVFLPGMTAYVLFRFLRHGRLFTAGGLLIAAGASCMLIELFQHITFGTAMFRWSLYCVGAFSAAGMLLLLAGMIPPLASCLERRFFI